MANYANNLVNIIIMVPDFQGHKLIMLVVFTDWPRTVKLCSTNI